MTEQVGQPAPAQHAARGVGLVVLTALMWSTSGIYIKGIDTPWVTIAFYRSLVAGLVLLPMAAVQLRRFGWGRPPHEPPGRWFAWMAVMAVSYFLTVSLFVWATKLTTAANAILLEFTAPAFAFLFSGVLLGTRIRGYEWFSLLIAMAGIAVLLAGAFSAPAEGGYQHVAGCLIAIASGVAFGMMQVAFRRVRGIGTAVATGLNGLATALLLTPVLLLWPAGGDGGLGASAGVTGSQLFWLVTMGVVNIAVPYLIFTAALRHIEATLASLVLLLDPVLNPLWVWLAQGEAPSGWTLLGGAIILAALAWLMLRARAESRRVGLATPSGV